MYRIIKSMKDYVTHSEAYGRRDQGAVFVFLCEQRQGQAVVGADKARKLFLGDDDRVAIAVRAVLPLSEILRRALSTLKRAVEHHIFQLMTHSRNR